MSERPSRNCSLRLAEAASNARNLLTPEAAQQICDFVLAQQQPDGGFRGRSSESDLYYTVFALWTLEALAAQVPTEGLRAYLHRFGDGSGQDFLTVVCLAQCLGCLPRSQRDPVHENAVLEHIERFRSKDGAYNRTMAAPCGAVYPLFLAVLARERLGAMITESAALRESLAVRQLPDGGFPGESSARVGTTPATAAAALLLDMTGGARDGRAAGWLLARASSRGGFTAGPKVPVPDLLSTATALHALRELHVPPDRIQHEACLDFVESLWYESGGFRGHPADPMPDCEYTFYALLALGCIPNPRN